MVVYTKKNLLIYWFGNFFCVFEKSLQQINIDDQCDSELSTYSSTKLNKNLPISNLTKLLNQHQSQKFIDTTKQINDAFKIESSLKKVI